ncbi:calmodulin-regulated spectrin-associated protein 1-like [Branchiostoma floridae x Branchiostoma japonicum]
MSEELQTRQTDTDDGPTVPDIVPLTEYDPFRAKVHASMLWAIGKAYGGMVPPELQWPFFTDDEGTEQLTPLLVGMLTAGELYCMICTQMFCEPCDWGGHYRYRTADAIVGWHADSRRAVLHDLHPDVP